MSISIDVDCISKSNNDFSFLSTIFDFVGNRDFIKDYSNRKDSMSNVTNTRTNVWLSLSAIGQSIGGEFQSNINNYIDNIINIDTCGTKGLESLALLLGTNYNVFNTIKGFPVDIIKLIDVLSIKKEYLANTYHVKKELANIIISNCSVDNSHAINSIEKLNAVRQEYLNLDSDLSNQWSSSITNSYVLNSIPILSVDAIDKMISSTFYNMINSKLYATYNDSLCTIIYKDLSNSILLSGFTLPNDRLDEIAQLKLKYSIEKSFDVEKEVDNIDSGISSYDDYSQYKKALIDIELDHRSEAFNVLELLTRNKYYKQKEVKDYFNFITNEYNKISYMYESSKLYEIDNLYFEIAADSDADKSKLIGTDLKIKDNYVQNVVEKLVYIVLSIRDVRDILKFFCQKNFMKGSFLLISYLINEYLKTNTYYNIKKNGYSEIQYDPNLNYSEIVQYIDPINYFNISTDVDSSSDAALSASLNVRYWESDAAVQAVGKIDSTDVFTIPPKINSNSFAFGMSELSTFYCVFLKNKFDKYKVSKLSSMTLTDHMTSFLASIFDIGADKTYFDNDEQQLKTVVDDEKLIPYKQKLYDEYTGNKDGENPFYYYANTRHPSYAIHPSLSTFIEQVDYSYPIENIATVVKDEIISLIKKSIDQYIDDDGYLINMWKNPLGSNQDYLSRYESTSNLNERLLQDPVVAYDGLFYLPAVNLIATDKSYEKVKEMLLSDTPVKEQEGVINYYYGLLLEKADRQKIVDLLSAFKTTILEEAKNAFDDDKKHVITRYGLDMYQNAYILVKEKKDTVKEQEDELGTLWIRLKNHPIAFPAFVYDDINVKTHNNNVLAQFTEKYPEKRTLTPCNNVLTNKCKRYYIHNTASKCKTLQIQDFYIALDKQDILLNYKTEDGDNTYLLTAVGTIVKEYDQINKQNLLYFNKANYEGDTQYELLFSNTKRDPNIHFACFNNNNKQAGELLYRVNNATNIDVYGAYYVIDSEKKQTIKEDISKNIDLDCPIVQDTAQRRFNGYDVCIDANDDNMFSIAYVGNTKLNNVKSYLGKEFLYDTANDYAKYLTTQLDNCIVTKHFDIYTSINEKTSETEDYSIRSSQFYNCYTDCGFFGLFLSKDPKNPYVNDIYNSALCAEAFERGILKFLLLGDKKPKAIDFKLCLPVLVREEYDNDGELSSYKDVQLVKYHYAHFLEDQVNATSAFNPKHGISEADYYDPIEVNKLLNGNYATLQINEEYILKMINDAGVTPDEEECTHRLLHDASTGPWLVKGYVPNRYANPGKDNKADNKPDGETYYYEPDSDSYFIKTTKQLTNISVSWAEVDGQIQLDFNTRFYKDIPTDKKFKNNLFNEKRLFLNLPKPGAAGYLNTYDLHGGYEATYYIKNISDKHPKFIMQYKIEAAKELNDLITLKNDNFIVQETIPDVEGDPNGYKILIY